MGKLDDLCAIKVMGYRIPEPADNCAPDTYWRHHGDMETLIYFRPSTSLDDALVCLERAFWKDGKKQFWFFKYWKGGYSCGPLSSEWAVTAVEPQIAMCLAALRAMGVPESEISIAME